MKYFSSPQISVVLFTPDNFNTIRNTVGYLKRQTAQNRMELVVVAPSRDNLDLNDSELKGFRWVKIVEVLNIDSVARGNVAGIRHATAAIVVLSEDHSFPDPGWAEALIRAHENPWAAVGPVVKNANPDSAISWADFFIGYGPWSDPSPAGVVNHLPGHNSSYKREILLEYGDGLESMLEAETVLHWDLRSRGFQIYLEPAARISHTNFSRISSWIPVQFLAGRVFAATRSKNWPLLKRIIYAIGSPLIPIVRFRRTISEMGKPHRLQNMELSIRLRILSALAVGLLLDGAGQFIGYALGAGNSKGKLSRYECHRFRHITEKDKKAIFEL